MNFKDYTHDVPYPSMQGFTTKYIYKGGKLVATLMYSPQNPEPTTIFEYGYSVIPKDPVVENVIDNVRYTAALDAYHAAEQEVYDKFKNDLFADLGIADNPRRHVLFDKAWERGHSSGLSEIYNVASDLVELIE